MNIGLRAIIIFLLNKKYIKNRHYPEKQLITQKTKYLNPEQKKQFDDEYKQFRDKFLFRTKKRTGKGSDWHISLDSKKVNEAYDLLKT